jgi:hypothetical protein
VSWYAFSSALALRRVERHQRIVEVMAGAARPGIRRFEMSVTEVAALLASMVALGPSATDAARSATAAPVDALLVS